MNSNWTRHLNPFHFETRTLFWIVCADVLSATCLLPLIFFVLKARAVSIHLTYVAQEATGKLDKITDPVKLHEILRNQIQDSIAVQQDTTHVLESISLLLAAIIFIFLMNAFASHKAHQRLKSSEVADQKEF